MKLPRCTRIRPFLSRQNIVSNSEMINARNASGCLLPKSLFPCCHIARQMMCFPRLLRFTSPRPKPSGLCMQEWGGLRLAWLIHEACENISPMINAIRCRVVVRFCCAQFAVPAETSARWQLASQRVWQTSISKRRHLLASVLVPQLWLKGNGSYGSISISITPQHLLELWLSPQSQSLQFPWLSMATHGKGAASSHTHFP